MSTVREIVSAIEKLKQDDFVKLQAKIDRIAEHLWQKEHKRISREFREKGLTDHDIDRMVLERRYRGRDR